MPANTPRSIALAAAAAILAFAAPFVFAAAPLYEPMSPPFVSWIEDGRPLARIVADDFGSSGTHPVETLNSHLEKIAGARLPVASEPSASTPNVFIGPVVGLSRVPDIAAEGLGADGFVLASLERDFVIAGANRLATVNAVHAFLEECLGVRWLWDDPLGEIVPQAPSVRVGRIRRIERPDMAVRWIGRGGWALRNRMNVALGEPDEYRVFGKAHTFLALVPPEIHLKSHPEFYAMRGGKRPSADMAPSALKSRMWQLCVSNPAVVRAMADSILAMAERDPALRMITVGPEDTQEFCECPRCVALDEPGAPYARRYSRRILIFYNQVAEAVAAANLALRIKGLAYHTYLAPPEDPAIVPRENLDIQVCRFMCHNHPLDDPDCPANAEFSQWLRQWSARSDHLFMYEYYNKGSWLNMPWPILHTLQTDLPALLGYSVRGVYSQYDRNLATRALNYYVAAKLLWNVRADVDALAADFCEKAYGPAAAPMLEYYTLLERAAIEADVHIAHQAASAQIAAMFTPPVLDALQDAIDRAKRLAGSAGDLARIELAELGLNYTRMGTDYLRGIDSIRRRIAETPGLEPSSRALEDNWAALEARARAIRAYLEAPEHRFIAGDSVIDHYMERFLDPRGVLQSWGRGDESWRR